MHRVHATTVEIGGRAVLIRGPSGSGKSDLALRLIDRGAGLVADDQTALSVEAGILVARPPAAIAGLIEVRGIGILRLDYRQAVPVALVVDLVSGPVERLPEPSFAEYLGVRLPCFELMGFEASAVAKVRLAVLSGTRDIMSLP